MATTQFLFQPYEVDKITAYLKHKGQYDAVINNSVFGGLDFELMIAANVINEKHGDAEEFLKTQE